MNGAPANPREAARFVFTNCGYDPATGMARFCYRFEGGPELVECIRFPHAPWPADPSRQAAFAGALDLLHGIAGVSYYKAGLSPRLDFARADGDLREFLTELYVKGLAEFGHLNGLDVAASVRFGATREAERPVTRSLHLPLPERALVAMGGGKDSLVGLDLLLRAGVEVLPFCVGGSGLIEDTVRVAGLPLLRIDRKLAPELAEMNRGGAWNGHVPVTAINSAIGVCAAILYGYRYVAFSNERSADEATLRTDDGREINHQYSKGSAFETAFRRLLGQRVSPDLEYFSILRPYSELAVMERFSGMKRFHAVYSSCNRNFHLDGPRVASRWCRQCPKCRFAVLGLALFLPPAEVRSIVGGDLLNDPRQEEGFRALCGLGRDKPFECVGEVGESRTALAALAGMDAWREHAIVRALAPELRGLDIPPLGRLLRPSAGHHIPPDISRILELPGARAGSGRHV